MSADQVLAQWEKSLNSGDLQSIVNLYAYDAILWSTFSKIIRNHPDLIKQYFEELFRKTKLKVNFSSSQTRVFENTHIYSGTYEFSYMDKELITFPARFTFVICKDNAGDYKIVEHHSSLIPTD